MKNKKHLFSILLMLIMALTLIPSMSVEAASKIKISNTKATMYIGSTETLKITGTSEKVTWTSSNKKVAIVSKKGKVTPKKVGTATITAETGHCCSWEVIKEASSTAATCEEDFGIREKEQVGAKIRAAEIAYHYSNTRPNEERTWGEYFDNAENIAMGPWSAFDAHEENTAGVTWPFWVQGFSKDYSDIGFVVR